MNSDAVCCSCGCKTVFKTEKVFEGWDCVGEKRRCLLCGAEQPAATPDEAKAAAAKSIQRVADLLGGEVAVPGKASDLLAGGASGFCKDCRHFVPHPFGGRCGLKGRVVESTDDCPSFEKRTEKRGN